MDYAELSVVSFESHRVLVLESLSVDVRSELDMVSRWLATWRTSLDCIWLLNATRTGSALVILRLVRETEPSSVFTDVAPPTPIVLRPSHVYRLLGSDALLDVL